MKWLNFSEELNLALGTLISEDLAFLYGLVELQEKDLNFLGFVLFYTIGVLVGDIGLYLLGRLTGPFIPKRLKAWVDKKLENLEVIGGFEQFLMLTRFIPGSRIPTYLYCGSSKYSLGLFTVILGATSIVYATFGATIAYFIPGEFGLASRVILAISVIFVTSSSFKIFALALKYQSQFGEIRRPLFLHFTKYRHHEFWSSWFFYIPIVPAFLYWAAKFGGFSSILSSNPAIKMSGLIGEKKSELDELIKFYTPNHHLKLFIPNNDDLDSIVKELCDHQIEYPFVVKPDSGMRGTDVEIVKNQDELNEYLLSAKKSFVIQQLSSYEREWGLLYMRKPSEKKGRIYSITEKDRLEIIGDGKRNLFELVISLDAYRDRFAQIFDGTKYSPKYIPQVDERILLVERGSHSKGAIFRDASEYFDSPLATEIVNQLDKYPNFCVARVDIRFADENRPHDFEIIEINGAGGESTNFYDPNLTLLDAYRIVFNHWSKTFEYGYLNRLQDRSQRVSILSLVKEIINYKRGIS